ncbi:MAG: hypothetical protein NUV75_12535 [Gallionella sp.]|nr:hypothetical protein [Gallionella sp.]
MQVAWRSRGTLDVEPAWTTPFGKMGRHLAGRLFSSFGLVPAFIGEKALSQMLVPWLFFVNLSVCSSRRRDPLWVLY